jgi:hypothetical protein
MTAMALKASLAGEDDNDEAAEPTTVSFRLFRSLDLVMVTAEGFAPRTTLRSVRSDQSPAQPFNLPSSSVCSHEQPRNGDF